MCKIMFFVNSILLLLPVLRLALILFYMYGMFGIFHVILFQYSGL